MAVETVAYTLQVPKEGKELIDAQAGLVKHFRNGGSVEEAVSLLPAVMQAVDGVGKVKEELQSQYKDELAAYSLHKNWEALEKEPEVAAQPE